MSGLDNRVYCPECMGSLTIGGVAMSNAPAWCVVTLDGLWSTPPLRRTQYRSQGVKGVVPLPMVEDEHEVSLRMLVAGGFNRLGVWQTDHQEGLQANLDYLDTNVWKDPGSATDTRAAVFTKPDGTVLQGSVQVGQAEVVIRPGPMARVVFPIFIVGARLA